MLRIVDALEDLDDVQNVWFNADIADEVMELVDRLRRSRAGIERRHAAAALPSAATAVRR